MVGFLVGEDDVDGRLDEMGMVSCGFCCRLDLLCFLYGLGAVLARLLNIEF